MKLSRNDMNALCDLAKIKNWAVFSDAQREQVAEKCRNMVPKIYEITEIEGVRNLDGARAVLEKSCLAVLNALGVALEDDTLDQLILSRALNLEFTAATAPAPEAKPTTTDDDLDF